MNETDSFFIQKTQSSFRSKNIKIERKSLRRKRLILEKMIQLQFPTIPKLLPVSIFGILMKLVTGSIAIGVYLYGIYVSISLCVFLGFNMAEVCPDFAQYFPYSIETNAANIQEPELKIKPLFHSENIF